MRLLLFILLLTTLVIIDQFKFQGHYGSEISRMVTKTIHSFT